MSSPDPRQRQSLEELLPRLSARLRALTVVVALLALGVLVLFATQYGALVNYWAGESLFFGVTSLGVALLAFGLGFLAGRWR